VAVVAPASVPISEQSTVQRSGMRIYPRDVGGPNQGSIDIQRGDEEGDEEDGYFRQHFRDKLAYTGGTYQEFDPAYRYGESMAGNPGYQDKPWENAEPELRSDWENKHPQSSWEKFKEAVREGWERPRPMRCVLVPAAATVPGCLLAGGGMPRAPPL
jgi:hypothetical protein